MSGAKVPAGSYLLFVPLDFVDRAFAYGNTFDLVDHHRRTLYTELEGPPVIARAEEDRVPAA